ncbi:hypothetical protein QYM36_013604 [Artemia franciscana]|uniref:Uncharacterized protein n=1 Tax=Artemia franciscana TaxID=6661 RepID=A0AA88L6N9_ARTSF|nr:hypothetical protein QYM36_013604 [Artemia franciscana]
MSSTGETFSKILQERIYQYMWLIKMSAAVAVQKFKYLCDLEDKDIKLVSFNSRLYTLPHFIILDHRSKSIIVGVRGTKSINDVITDLTCNNVVIIEQRRPMYMGHRGMVESATRIKRQIKDILLAFLEEPFP